LSVGSLAVTNHSNAGDHFTASNNFSNNEPEPAERRVSASGLAYGGDGGDDSGEVGVPPWIANPYRLISWWDMEKFSAETFFSIGAVMQQIKSIGEQDEEEPIIVTRYLHPLFDMFITNCDLINLSVSSDLMKELKRDVGPETKAGDLPNPMLNREFSSRVGHISKTITIEMMRSMFMYIPRERADRYSKEEAFGPEVNNKFPSSHFDIKEAGNCFASARFTACVFHLMRVLEIGLVSIRQIISRRAYQQRELAADYRENRI